MNQRVQTLLKNQGSDFFSRIGKLGFQAVVDKYFEGDREAAKKWLVARGQWVQDKDLSYAKPGVFTNPGPHPAHKPPWSDWLDHAERNLTGLEGPV